MTDLYNSFPLPKIVFFHGLNNNPECFGSLMSYFQEKGFETEMIILPCHGTNRKEARTAQEAQEVFEASMKRLQGLKYYAIAFSHGALYLQLWLEKHQESRPLKQVLLAPALFIRKQKLIEKAMRILPSFVLIKSLAPKAFRRYEILTKGEYNILVQGIVNYQSKMSELKVPSLIMIDPKDELVHAQKLKEEIEVRNENFKVHFIERPYLKKGMGCHHILFHPEYFSHRDWQEFTQKIRSFLT